MLTFRRTVVILGSLLLCMLPAGASAAAAKASSSTDTATQPVTQGYATDTALQQGMIVKLDDKDATKVEALTTSSVAQMLGVIVPANGAAATLSGDNNSGQVFVASYGRYDVLVSNQNGPIKAGDYITISALAGIGMKVDTTQPIVLGRAAANFDGSANVDSTTSLKATNGSSVSVAIGRIPVDVSISHNPLLQNEDKGLPSFLRRASEQIANKQVGTARVYISLVVLFMATFLAASMLYSGIRGGLVAIGRNPLAKQSIMGTILRVVLSGSLVFVIGLFGVYLILRL